MNVYLKHEGFRSWLGAEYTQTQTNKHTPWLTIVVQFDFLRFFSQTHDENALQPRLGFEHTIRVTIPAQPKSIKNISMHQDIVKTKPSSNTAVK